MDWCIKKVIEENVTSLIKNFEQTQKPYLHTKWWS